MSTDASATSQPETPEWKDGRWTASVELSDGYTTEDYRKAPSNDGPFAYTWRDKPHRLVYDLEQACESLSRLLEQEP